MATQRYNSGIQRAKGLLEIAAALYDTSLSHQSERATVFTVAAAQRSWPARRHPEWRHQSRLR
jgi:hypothetical protein